MKKAILLLIVFFALCFSVNAQMLQGIAGGGVAAGGSGETALIYFEFESISASANDALLNSIDSSYIGTQTGDATVGAACNSNGMIADSTGDYVTISAAELTAAGLTDWNTGEIVFSVKFNTLDAGKYYVFYQYSNFEGPRLHYSNSDSRWELYVFENSTETLKIFWINGDPVADTCRYYKISWVVDPATAESTDATLSYSDTWPVSSWTVVDGKTIYTQLADADPISLGNLTLGYPSADTNYAMTYMDTFKIYPTP